MELSARIRTGVITLAALAGCGGWFAPSARAQNYDKMMWGGVPNQSGLNGLWWGSYDAFSSEARYGFGADFYLPPAHTIWNGPYFTVAHETPYIPRPVSWNGLEYSEPNAPPESTRPHGWYGPFSAGWRSDPANAREYWEYIVPDRRARAEARAAAAANDAAAASQADRIVPRPPPQARQYTREPAPAAGQSSWRPHDAPDPETQLAPAPIEPRGFTQYYRQTAPGPDQGRWVKKSATVATKR